MSLSPTQQAFEEVWRKSDGSTKDGGRKIFEAGMATATLIQTMNLAEINNWRTVEPFLRDLMDGADVVWQASPLRPAGSFMMSWRNTLRSIFANSKDLSSSSKSQPDSRERTEDQSKAVAPLTPRANGRTEYRGENRLRSEGDASPTQKFRKKPVIVEAMRFDGRNALGINFFTNRTSYPTNDSLGHSDWARKKLIIPTLEGDMVALCGDWIIKGVNGEFYPCKPDIFENTYEPV